MMKTHELPDQTCKTHKTCSEVKNSQFIDAVFHTLNQGAEPYIVSFDGNPNTVNKGSWARHPNDVDKVRQNNNFFGISSYIRGKDGNLSRRKSDFSALHAIMLDDIGSKVDRSLILLPPSWLIETSPGNFQAGYILDAPVEDPVVADHLMNAIIAAGLTDPGANGPTARLARLPVGCNGKYKGSPPTELHAWDPSLHYSVKDISDAYQLDLTPRRSHVRNVRTDQGYGDDILIPATEENPVIASLIEKGLYKAKIGVGKHDITCPWVDEHTDSIDHGTAYFEPTNEFPKGGFHCFHSHGADLKLRHFLDFLQVTDDQIRFKPTIRFRPGMLDTIVTHAEQIMADTREIFQFGGMVVSIETDKVSGEVSTNPLDQTQIVRMLDQISHWEHFRVHGSVWTPIDPPTKIAEHIFKAGKNSKIPPLRGIARQPFFREDGSPVTGKGYDAASMIYGAFDPSEYPVSENPTQEDARLALQRLKELIEEVPFATPEDESAALSALLTAAIRPSLPTAPGFNTVAHSIGSGKSFLNKIIAAFATPQQVPGVAFPSDKDEMTKTLVALLMKSPAVINFDDLNGDIYPSESLKMALTEPFILGRILGCSKDVSCSTRTLFLFSGNNVYPIRDMTRRVISIHLDPQCETPATRIFKNPNLEKELRTNRGSLVSSAITMINAWISAGSPITNVKPLASFTDWSMYCRQPLLWLGLPDPVARLFEQLQYDPDREILGRILNGWHQLFGTRAVLIREAIPKFANRDSDIHDAVFEIAEKHDRICPKKLGWWIKKHSGQIVDGRRFESGGDSRGAKAWKVTQVSRVLQDLDDEARTLLGYDLVEEDIL